MTTSTQTGTALISGMDIAAYITSDPQRSIAFYRDVLGIEPTDIDADGRGAEFTLADSSTFGVWKPDPSATAGGMMMFAVPDIHDALTVFRKRGAGLSDPMERPCASCPSAWTPMGTDSSSISARTRTGSP